MIRSLVVRTSFVCVAFATVAMGVTAYRLGVSASSGELELEDTFFNGVIAAAYGIGAIAALTGLIVPGPVRKILSALACGVFAILMLYLSREGGGRAPLTPDQDALMRHVAPPALAAVAMLGLLARRRHKESDSADAARADHD